MGDGVSLSESGAVDLEPLLGAPRMVGSRGTRFSVITWDDRQIPGDLFVAIPGSEFDGASAIPQMLQRGVGAVVTETSPPPGVPGNVTWWQVQSAREKLALLLQHAHRHPGRELPVFGITGTNGKSSTVRMLATILDEPGKPAGWVTTVDRSIAGTLSESLCTTPPAHELAELLRTHVDGAGGPMVLEISSHAIDQHRIGGIPLAAAAVTQFGRDHLDYHGTEAAYHEVKRRLRHHVCDGGVFLVPSAKHGSADTLAFEDGSGDRIWRARILDHSPQGCRIRLMGEDLDVECELPKPARHDVSNALCAAALASSVGVSADRICLRLENAGTIPGRMEQVSPGIFVDYAHTPDALEAVLMACRNLCDGTLRVVFGCGGDRDSGKREEMGRIAAALADEIYLTDDNPRSEPSAQILQGIRSGIGAFQRVTEEADRRKAIAMAVQEHRSGDILVVAGKGHETTQEIRGVKAPFDDRSVVQESVGGIR